MQVRRVVIGFVAGVDAVTDDAEVPVPLDEGTRLVELWRVVGSAGDASAGFAPAESQGIVQDAGGLAWRVFVLGPGERPLHRTPTLDLLEVLDGSIVVTLEVGEAPLHAGDCLVLRGDVHGWRNDAEQPAILVAAMFGTGDEPGERSGVARYGDAGPRRVVTGLDEEGRAIVAADGVPPNAWGAAEGVGTVDLWHSLGPITHPAQGGDIEASAFDWQPAGGGIAWRHVSVAPGASLPLRGQRLDLVMLRRGELTVDLAADAGAALHVDALTAIVRRGSSVDLRNESGQPVHLSVLSVCTGVAG